MQADYSLQSTCTFRRLALHLLLVRCRPNLLTAHSHGGCRQPIVLRISRRVSPATRGILSSVLSVPSLANGHRRQPTATHKQGYGSILLHVLLNGCVGIHA
jgi:hypothetical protein